MDGDNNIDLHKATIAGAHAIANTNPAYIDNTNRFSHNVSNANTHSNWNNVGKCYVFPRADSDAELNDSAELHPDAVSTPDFDAIPNSLAYDNAKTDSNNIGDSHSDILPKSIAGSKPYA